MSSICNGVVFFYRWNKSVFFLKPPLSVNSYAIVGSLKQNIIVRVVFTLCLCSQEPKRPRPSAGDTGKLLGNCNIASFLDRIHQ